MGARNEGAAIILCLSSAIACFGSPGGAGDPGRPQPLRLTVTHFQDRTQSDEYLWLRESLADQLRALLTAGGMEVVDYSALEAVGQEQVIADTGLPDPRAMRDVKVAQSEIAITGEYVVDDGGLKLVITASRIDPPELVTRVAGDGDARSGGDLLRTLVPDLLQGLDRSPEPALLRKIQTVRLPSYEFQRWFHEGSSYLAVGMYPEAWYCFSQAVEKMPDHLEARRLRFRALREMGLADHAIAETDALIPLIAQYVYPGQTTGIVLDNGAWMPPRFESLWRRGHHQNRVLGELWSALREIIDDPFTEQTPLVWPICKRVAQLYDSPWELFARAQETDLLAVDSDEEFVRLEALETQVVQLRAREALCRYWRLKGDVARATAELLKARQTWDRVRELLRPHGIEPSDLADIEAEFEKLRAAIDDPQISPRQRELVFHPVTPPQGESKKIPDSSLDGQEWSEVRHYGWVKEFTPTQMLRAHDGRHVAVGIVTFPTSGGAERKTWLAYILSDDGEVWSEPLLFPAPINTRRDHNTYPILLPISDGSYTLGWISDRNSDSPVDEHRVYISRSPDLSNWSRAIRTPAVGQFDIAELPDGSLMIAAHNTLITRTVDFVNWSPPRLAVVDLDLRCPSSTTWLDVPRDYPSRHPRLIMTDDRRLHLLAVVTPGAGRAVALDMLVHAVSEDGMSWSSSLKRPADYALGYAATSGNPISAAPVSGGGLALLMMERRAASRQAGKRKEVFHDILFSVDGQTWHRRAEVPRSRFGPSINAPRWGGLAREKSGQIRLSMSTSERSYRTVALADSFLRGAHEVIPLTDVLVYGTPWNEESEDDTQCVVFDTCPGGSELEHMANSLGLLVQRDLQMLKGVQPLMAVGLHSGISIADADFAHACRRSGIRWADYVVQFHVQRQGDEYLLRGRAIDVANAKTVYDNTIKSDDTALPAAQKAFSRDLADLLRCEFRSPRLAECFDQQLANRPESFVYLSIMGLARAPDQQRSEQLLQWAQADPQSPLPHVFSFHLRDSGAGSRSQLGSREQRNRAQWRHPLDPFQPDFPYIETSSEFVGDNYRGVRYERRLCSIPKCLPLRLSVLRGWMYDGIFERARPHLEYLQEHFSDDPPTVAECARAQEFMGDFEGARNIWSRFVETWPDDDRSWPYWYCETDRDDYDPILIPAAVRLAMAEIRLGVFGKSVDIVREWYEGDETPLSHSPAKTLGLALHLHALLATGRAEQAAETAFRQLHVPDKPDGWIYYHPATVHYIYALMETGRRTPARNHLSGILNRGYWYRDYHRAFVCPPELVLREELLRMQLHRPLMGL